MAQEVAEQSLSRDELIALKNRRTGVTVFQISWIMVFVCLIMVNFQIRSGYPTWPPPDVIALDRILPTLATVALIASAVVARGAAKAIQTDNKAAFLSGWRTSLILGAAFILIMAFEWLTTSIEGQYGAIFRVMTAYHALHALAIGYIMYRVYGGVERNAYGKTFDPLRFWIVDGSLKLWYFVVIAWLMFYVVLYLI